MEIPQHITELLILALLIITFAQSGVDKITDWKGNVSFLQGHFKETIFKGIVPLLLSAILITEIIASVLMIVGAYQLLTNGETQMALYGLILSAITLLALLFGQRIAKDYAGAMTLVVYFIPTVFCIYLLT
jgi:uncharacterized membrane protein